MKVPLRVLLVEDSPADAERILHRLESAGYAPDFERVSALSGLAEALRGKSWDLVISEYTLPEFSGLEALKAVKSRDQNIPFIFATRRAGEEAAAQALRAGAEDFFEKDRLARLGETARRELRQAAGRRAKSAAESGLRQSENRYARLLESTSEPAFLCSRGLLACLNPAAVRALGGKSPLDFIGHPAEAFVEMRDRQSFWEFLNKTESGHGAATLRMELSPLASPALPVEATVRHVSYYGEAAAQVVCRPLPAPAREGARNLETIGRAAEGMANDFNNFLTAILGHAELARKGLPAYSPLARNIEHITRNAERAFRFSQQLMALNSKRLPEQATVRLNALVETLEPAIRRLADGQNEVEICLGANMGEILAEPGLFQSMILSLVAQACDMLPKGGLLKIATSTLSPARSTPLTALGLPKREYAVLSISNSAGTRPEEAGADEAPAAGPSPVEAGLEYATVYTLVKQLGGHIWSSHQRGKDSSFRVFLPCARKPGVGARSSGTLKTHGVVLLVENEEILRGFAQAVLEKKGFSVLPAENGVEALRIWESSAEPIDIVVTDICMPEMGGLELADRLQETRPGVPILFTSGYTSNIISESGQEGARNSFLAKPYSSTDLVVKIKEMLVGLES